MNKQKNDYDNNMLNRNQNYNMNPRNNTTKLSNTSTSTGTSSSTSSSYSGSTVFGIVLLVIILLLVIGASYWAYQYYTKLEFRTYQEVEALKEIKDASSKFSVGSNSIPSSKYSNEYSISMWLNIADYKYNYGKEKTILRRGEAGSGNPEIVLDAKENNLIVRLKLQGVSSNVYSKSALTVSNFTNIENIENTTSASLASMTQIPIPSGINEPDNKQFDYNLFNQTGTSNPNQHPNYNNVFKLISGNDIDYPTVKYINNEHSSVTIDSKGIINNMENNLLTQKNNNIITHDNNTKGELESFQDLIKPEKMSDNSAPVESQMYHNEFFNLVSGNEVVPPCQKYCNKLKLSKYSNLPTNPSVMEKFTDAGASASYTNDDMVNVFANVLIDLCNIMKLIKQQKYADDDVNIMNGYFQTLMSSLETARINATTSEDIMVALNNGLDKILLTSTANNTLMGTIESLKKNLITLNEISNSDATGLGEGQNNSNIQAIANAVNLKLANQNCELKLSGSNEINMEINLYKNMLEMIKKSLYTYLNNLGYQIQLTYPELKSSSQSAQCIIDTQNNTDPSIGVCIVRQIPLQKWINVIVSVYNQIVDIYIDGHLASSCVLKGFPTISNNDVQITPDGGFSGQIGRIVFSNTAMTAYHAKEVYYSGPVASDSIFSMIPNWVYYLIAFIIIGLILYSIFM